MGTASVSPGSLFIAAYFSSSPLSESLEQARGMGEVNIVMLTLNHSYIFSQPWYSV